MTQPTFSVYDLLSSATDATSYTGAVKNYQVNFRCYLLFYRVTAATGPSPPDPIVTLATAGTVWEKLQTDNGSGSASGFYALQVLAPVFDAVKIDFGTFTVTGIDLIVVECVHALTTGVNADTFIVSAQSTATDTAPTASLASAPPANALTMGFAAKDATTGFSAGTGWGSAGGTAGHTPPPSRAAVEFDTGTPTQVSTWSIPASVKWYAYTVAARFDEHHAGVARVQTLWSATFTEQKDTEGAGSVSAASSTAATAVGTHPGAAALSHDPVSAATGKKGAETDAALTTVSSLTGTINGTRGGAARMTALVLVDVEPQSSQLQESGTLSTVVAQPDASTVIPEEWPEAESDGRAYWDPITRAMVYVGADFRAYPVLRVGPRLVPYPRVDLFQSTTFVSQRQVPARAALDPAGRHMYLPWTHVQDVGAVWPKDPELLTQHLMVLDLDLVANRPLFNDRREFAYTNRTSVTPGMPLWQPGDLVIVSVSLSLSPLDADVTASAGWRQLFQIQHPSTFGRFAAFYRRMLPDDPPPTLSWATLADPAGVVVAYRGVHELGPVPLVGYSTGTGTTATRPGVQPTTPNNRILGFYFAGAAQPLTTGEDEVRRAEQEGVFGVGWSVLATDEDDLAGLGVTHSEAATIAASEPWGAFTVLLRPGPMVPIVQRRELGAIRHEIIAPSGETAAIRLGDWEAIETAAGGYISAKGTLDADMRLKVPTAIVDGAQLVSRHVPTNEVVWAGRILDPATKLRRGDITAVGVGAAADKVFPRILWQNSDTEDWVPQSSDDLGDIPTDEDKMRVDITPARINVTLIEHLTLAGGERQGAAFSAFPESVTRLAFTLKAKASHSQFVVRIRGGPGPTYDAATWQKIGSDISLSSYTEPIDIDLPLVEAPEVVVIALERKTGATSSDTNPYWVRFVNPRVNGRASEDEYSVSAEMRDLFGLLGIPLSGMSDVGVNGLPRDVVSQSVAQTASDIAILADGWWGISHNGAQPIGAFNRWGSKAWYLTNARGLTLVPQKRYDSVGVPFRKGNSSTLGLAVVDAPYRLAESRMFTVDNLTEVPHEVTAYAIAAALAPYMVSERFAGDGELAEVSDEAGTRWSAHRVHFGDVLIVPGYTEPFRVAQLRRTDSGISCVFPDSTSRIQSIIAATVLAAGTK